MEFAQSYDYYYSVTKRVLSLVGQWPYQKRRTRLFRVSLLTVATFSMAVPEVGKFIQCDGDVQCSMLIIPSFLVLVIILIKLYTFQFNSSKIKSLVDYVQSDWQQLKNAEEYKIMKTYAANARLLSLVYWIWYYMTALIFISISLVPQVLNVVLPRNESWPIIMPYEAYYFVENGEKYFFYIYFHVLISLEISLTAIIAHDCMLLAYIEHVCSVFAVAGYRFEVLSCNDHDNAVNNNLDDLYYQKMAVSVCAHWRALRFAELLEKTFYISFAVQIVVITVAMSVTLLQIALQLDNIVEATRYMAFTTTQLFHIFCYSLQGQRLIDHSVQIRDKIYNSSWYDIPVTSQRLLLYVMRRSMQSNFLTAGKIYVFSLKSFTTVVQSSVSYFTVLASFH